LESLITTGTIVVATSASTLIITAFTQTDITTMFTEAISGLKKEMYSLTTVVPILAEMIQETDHLRTEVENLHQESLMTIFTIQIATLVLPEAELHHGDIRPSGRNNNRVIEIPSSDRNKDNSGSDVNRSRDNNTNRDRNTVRPPRNEGYNSGSSHQNPAEVHTVLLIEATTVTENLAIITVATRFVLQVTVTEVHHTIVLLQATQIEVHLTVNQQSLLQIEAVAFPEVL